MSLEYAFRTEEKLFFVMKFMRGGELFKHLRDQRRFSEQTAKFYAGSVVLAFEYLHAMKVVYRDLKPENILLDDQGYVKVTDFGLAKQLSNGEGYKKIIIFRLTNVLFRWNPRVFGSRDYPAIGTQIRSRLVVIGGLDVSCID